MNEEAERNEAKSGRTRTEKRRKIIKWKRAYYEEHKGVEE